MKIKKRTLLECCQEFCNGRQDEDIENKIYAWVEEYKNSIGNELIYRQRRGPAEMEGSIIRRPVLPAKDDRALRRSFTTSTLRNQESGRS